MLDIYKNITNQPHKRKTDKSEIIHNFFVKRCKQEKPLSTREE